jgi:hypothetical protein
MPSHLNLARVLQQQARVTHPELPKWVRNRRSQPPALGLEICGTFALIIATIAPVAGHDDQPGQLTRYSSRGSWIASRIPAHADHVAVTVFLVSVVMIHARVLDRALAEGLTVPVAAFLVGRVPPLG